MADIKVSGMPSANSIEQDDLFMTVQDAGAMISYYGWIKGSNSRNFYIKNVKKYINIQKCKKIVRDYNRNNS